VNGERGMGDEVPRIGCVPYLNARPLLEGLNFPIKELVPSSLIEEFKGGELDVALLSSIDVISQSDPSVVDGVAIGSRGDVHSVVLAYTGELCSIREVCLDPSSRTSNALLQILLGEFHGIHPNYVRLKDIESKLMNDSLPTLLIGDPAISYRKRTSNKNLHFLDLGGEWYRYTGLPFVFAMWSLAKENTNKKELSRILREAKDSGLRNLSGIASRTPDPDFALRYLGEWIRYELGDDEKRGLSLFTKLLTKDNLISSDINEIKYF
jgi:predicted solute-binding protein